MLESKSVCNIGFVLLICTLMITSFIIHSDVVGEEVTSSSLELRVYRHRDCLRLEWDILENNDKTITGYNIYRALGYSKTLYYKRIDDPSTTTYIDENIEKGRTYKYYVTIICEEEQSSTSNKVFIKANGYNVPTQALNLKAYPGNSKICLEWDPPIDDGGKPIEGYYIYKNTSKAEDMSLIKEIGRKTIFVDYDVQNYVEYSYTVSTVNMEGEGEKSKRDFTLPQADITNPDPPKNLTVYSGYYCIELYWEKPSFIGNTPIKNYIIYKKEKDNHLGLVEEIIIENTTYMDPDLEGGRNYTYTVSAVNVEGESLKSNEGEGKHTIDIPSPPSEFFAKNMSDSIKISWIITKNEEIRTKKIIVYRGLNEDNISYYKELDDDKGKFIDKEIDQENTYYYTVRRVNLQNEISNHTTLQSATIEKTELINITDILFYGMASIIILITLIFLASLWKKRIDMKEKDVSQIWESSTKKKSDKAQDKNSDEKSDKERQKFKYHTEEGQIRIKKREEEW